MSRTIAGTYEIYNKIGSGGGGIVYLGRHLRLDKLVVLKEYKHVLHTKPEALRREVDLLKGLSHSYIPQVYDYLQEDGAVYTVMDYIEGTSLDMLLEKQGRVAQPQVIRWAVQLLEALRYLHGVPPYGILHGDIKPANIMLRPNGNICLIDYNIALALGENGAVRAGLSRGYASPEHLGLEYAGSGIGSTQTSSTRTGKKNAPAKMAGRGHGQVQRETVTMKESTETLTSRPVSGNSASEKNSILLDARSDIYSLGATLYHLLSGKRPDQDAMQVEGLGREYCSEAVSFILRKAMAPDPDLRYQSAEEMLEAFLQLRRQDVRSVRHRRRIYVSSATLILLFLAGGICAMTGLKRMEQMQKALALAEYSANALAEGDTCAAVDFAMRAVPGKRGILDISVFPQVYRALSDALGVYDLSDGFKSFRTIELPSAPFKLAVCGEGNRFAAVYAYEAAIYDMERMERLAVLPLEPSAFSDVSFIDENTILYAGPEGVAVYDLVGQSKLWQGNKATTLALSADHSVAAAVDRNEGRISVYRTENGEKTAELSLEERILPTPENDIFADPQDEIFALNRDGSLLAVSFSDGSLIIFNLKNPAQNLILFDRSDYSHFEGGFCGEYFAFTAYKSGGSVFAMADTQEGICMEGYQSGNRMRLEADEEGIYLADGSLLVRFEPKSLKETELAHTKEAFITNFAVASGYTMAAADDGSFSFFDASAKQIGLYGGSENCDFTALTQNYALAANRNEPSVRVLKLENHEDTLLMSYDPRLEHDEARISHDGKTFVFYDYRHFTILDRNGRMISEVRLPDAEKIYDQQFRREEKASWLEVIWYDGTVRRYSAADGILLSEERGEMPERDLYEEFVTEKYRIKSPLHGTPEVYELESGKRIGSLEEDAYLAYVTQMGRYLMTEYINTAGERYGLLLNEDLQVCAYFPGLCDIWNGNAVFDYHSGELRQCRLYSFQELTALGETFKEKK